jgi:hypothetical protein
MNSEQNIHTLRVQLLAMSRLSQRALDYSVKDMSCAIWISRARYLPLNVRSKSITVTSKSSAAIS